MGRGDREIDNQAAKDTAGSAEERLRDEALSVWRHLEGERRPEEKSQQRLTSSKDPYAHLELARLAGQEYGELGRIDADQKVSVVSANGQSRSLTVRERRQELLLIADEEFRRAVDCADAIDLKRLDQRLLEVQKNLRIAETTTDSRTQRDQEAFLLSLRAAATVVRFHHATFLAHYAEPSKAQGRLAEILQRNPALERDSDFRNLSRHVEIGLRAQTGEQGTTVLQVASALDAAHGKQRRGDAAGAEHEYKKALEQAKAIDPQVVRYQLRCIQQQASENAMDQSLMAELTRQEQFWTFAGQAQTSALTRYAEFLTEQGRYKDAQPLLREAVERDPALIVFEKDFAALFERAHSEGQDSGRFDNPFVHLNSARQSLEKSDTRAAKTELEGAVAAADKIDRGLMQLRKKAIDQLLADRQPEEVRKKLEEWRRTYDEFDHSAAFARVALARLEVADRDYNHAQQHLAEAEHIDPEFCRTPKLEFGKLKELALEPSAIQQTLNVAGTLLKELSCDLAAVLAGVAAGMGVGAATSLSGPGAVVLGAAAATTAGSAVYTAMKTQVYGEDFRWSMVGWGALDGLSGGTTAMARAGLTGLAGRAVSREATGAAVIRAGGQAAAIEGAEGIRLLQLGQSACRDGVSQIARGLTWQTRLASRVPLMGLGSPEYRAALSAYRGIKYRNLATSMFVNGGSIAAGSSLYRLGTEGHKYSTGEHKSFLDFAAAYGTSVLGDAATGATVGAYGRGFGSGLLASGLRHGGAHLFSGSGSGWNGLGRSIALGAATDMMVSTPSWILGDSTSRLAAMAPKLHFGADLLFSSISPRWYERYQASNGCEALEKLLAQVNTRPDSKAIAERMLDVPGTMDERQLHR